MMNLEGCQGCTNMLPIGQGDHICMIAEPILVLDGYVPTDEYYWCQGDLKEEF